MLRPQRRSARIAQREKRLMATVMHLPELVRMILEHLPNKDLPAALRINRLFFELGVPLVWRVPTLPAMKAILGSSRQHIYASQIRCLFSRRNRYRRGHGVNGQVFRSMAKLCSSLRKLNLNYAVVKGSCTSDLLAFLNECKSLEVFVADREWSDRIDSEVLVHLAARKNLLKAQISTFLRATEVSQSLAEIHTPFSDAHILVLGMWPDHGNTTGERVELVSSFVAHVAHRRIYFYKGVIRILYSPLASPGPEYQLSSEDPGSPESSADPGSPSSGSLARWRYHIDGLT